MNSSSSRSVSAAERQLDVVALRQRHARSYHKAAWYARARERVLRKKLPVEKGEASFPGGERGATQASPEPSQPLVDLSYRAVPAPNSLECRTARVGARHTVHRPMENVELDGLAAGDAAGAAAGRKLGKQKTQKAASKSQGGEAAGGAGSLQSTTSSAFGQLEALTTAQGASDLSIVHASVTDGCPSRYRISKSLVFEVDGPARELSDHRRSTLHTLYRTDEKVRAVWGEASAAWNAASLKDQSAAVTAAAATSSVPSTPGGTDCQNLLHPQGNGKHLCVAVGTMCGTVLVYELTDAVVTVGMDHEASSTTAPQTSNARPVCAKGHPMVASNYLHGGYEDGWHCDRCGKGWAILGHARWFCQLCEADVCFSCHPVPVEAEATTERRWQLRQVRQAASCGISSFHFAHSRKILFAGCLNGTIHVVATKPLGPRGTRGDDNNNDGHRRIVSCLSGGMAVTSMCDVRLAPRLLCVALGQSAQQSESSRTARETSCGGLCLVDVATDVLLKRIPWCGSFPKVLCQLPPQLAAASSAPMMAECIRSAATSAAGASSPPSSTDQGSEFPSIASMLPGQDRHHIHVGDSLGRIHSWAFRLSSLFSSDSGPYRGTLTPVWEPPPNRCDAALDCLGEGLSIVQMRCVRLAEKEFVSIQSYSGSGSVVSRRQRRRLYFFVGVGHNVGRTNLGVSCIHNNSDITAIYLLRKEGTGYDDDMSSSSTTGLTTLYKFGAELLAGVLRWPPSTTASPNAAIPCPWNAAAACSVFHIHTARSKTEEADEAAIAEENSDSPTDYAAHLARQARAGIDKKRRKSSFTQAARIRLTEADRSVEVINGVAAAAEAAAAAAAGLRSVAPATFCLLTCGCVDGRIVRLSFDVAELNEAADRSLGFGSTQDGQSLAGTPQASSSNPFGDEVDMNPFGNDSDDNMDSPPDSVVSSSFRPKYSSAASRPPQVMFSVDISTEVTVQRARIIAISSHLADELAASTLSNRLKLDSVGASAGYGADVNMPGSLHNYVAMDEMGLLALYVPNDRRAEEAAGVTALKLEAVAAAERAAEERAKDARKAAKRKEKDAKRDKTREATRNVLKLFHLDGIEKIVHKNSNKIAQKRAKKAARDAQRKLQHEQEKNTAARVDPSALGMLPPGEIERRERLRASATVFNEDPVYAVRYLLTEKLHVIARGRPALARYLHECGGLDRTKVCYLLCRRSVAGLALLNEFAARVPGLVDVDVGVGLKTFFRRLAISGVGTLHSAKSLPSTNARFTLLPPSQNKGEASPSRSTTTASAGEISQSVSATTLLECQRIVFEADSKNWNWYPLLFMFARWYKLRNPLAVCSEVQLYLICHCFVDLCNEKLGPTADAYLNARGRVRVRETTDLKQHGRDGPGAQSGGAQLQQAENVERKDANNGDASGKRIESFFKTVGDSIRETFDDSVQTTVGDDTKKACQALLAAAGVLRCRNGHDLVQFTTPAQTYTCDECGQQQRLRATMAGCRLCDFDLCEQCIVSKADCQSQSTATHCSNELPRNSSPAAPAELMSALKRATFAAAPLVHTTHPADSSMGPDEECVEVVVAPGAWRGTAEEFILADFIPGQEEKDAVGKPSVNFTVSRPPFVAFLRDVLALAEDELGLNHYHFRLCAGHTEAELRLKIGDCKLTMFKGSGMNNLQSDANEQVELLRAAAQAGFLILLVGRRKTAGNTAMTTLEAKPVPRCPALEEMDVPIRYTARDGRRVALPVTQQDICIGEVDVADASSSSATEADRPERNQTLESRGARAFLDAQGRPLYIGVLKRFVRRQSDASDAELTAVWRLVVGLAAELPGGLIDVRVNAGLYQNVAHLHLKARVNNSEFAYRWKDHEGYQAVTRAAKQRLLPKPPSRLRLQSSSAVEANGTTTDTLTADVTSNSFVSNPMLARGENDSSSPVSKSVAQLSLDDAPLETHESGANAIAGGGSVATLAVSVPPVVRPRRKVMQGWLKKWPSQGNIGLAHRRWFVLKEVPSMVTLSWWASDRPGPGAPGKKGVLSLAEGAVRHMTDILTGQLGSSFEVSGEDNVGNSGSGEIRVFVAEADTPAEAAKWVAAIEQSVRQLRQGRGLPSPSQRKKSPEKSIAQGLKSVTDAFKSIKIDPIKIDWGGAGSSSSSSGSDSDSENQDDRSSEQFQDTRIVVTVPAGLGPGDKVLVESPNVPGTQFIAIVPEGVEEGMRFQVKDPTARQQTNDNNSEPKKKKKKWKKKRGAKDGVSKAEKSMRDAFQSLTNAFQDDPSGAKAAWALKQRREKPRKRHLVSGLMSRVNLSAPHLNLQLRLHSGAGMQYKFALRCINAIRRANFLRDQLLRKIPPLHPVEDTTLAKQQSSISTVLLDHYGNGSGNYLVQHALLSKWVCLQGQPGSHSPKGFMDMCQPAEITETVAGTPMTLECPHTSILTDLFFKLRKSQSLLKLITHARLTFVDEEHLLRERCEASQTKTV